MVFQKQCSVTLSPKYLQALYIVYLQGKINKICFIQITLFCTYNGIIAMYKWLVHRKKNQCAFLPREDYMIPHNTCFKKNDHS